MDYLHKVECFVILDAEGRRLFGKYYPKIADGASSSSSSAGSWPTVEAQAAYEKQLHAKLRDPRTNGSTTAGNGQASPDGDVMLHDGKTLLFKVDPELTFVVVGGIDENELVLMNVLGCIYEAFQLLSKSMGSIDKRTLLENYDALVLVVDEVLDDGIILETTASTVVQEVQPFLKVENATAVGAKKALKSFSKYMKHNI